MIKIQDNAIQSTEINEETEENPETCLDGSDGVVNQYEEDECQKLHLLKMAVVDILDRMEITLPRITCERASKGSHFGTSWVDFKSLNPEEIVKERILNNVDIPLLEEKGAMSTCTQSTENSESGDADRGTTDMYEITAVSLMADVNVIAIDNFKRTEKNQISLRRGMVLKQVLAANQDGFAHGYSTSGLFCSPKKYGYYPACKVVLYKTDV